ncbi:MAG: hypothetical protein J0I08_18405 [Rhizobiales bacterium]|nr:hypothetical protein [Hyphomicrobiales bacterium]
MIWPVRALVICAFVSIAPVVLAPNRQSFIANALAGLLTGIVVVWLASRIGRKCEKLSSAYPVAAQRVGMAIYVVSIALTVICLGFAAFAAYSGAGRELVIVPVSTSIIYWAAGWGLYRSLTYGRSMPVARKRVEIAGDPPFRTDGNTSATKLSAFTSRRHKKIALSLAIVGALASPFVFRTYKASPLYAVWVPLTPQQKENLAASLQASNDCRSETSIVLDVVCSLNKERFELGGEYEYHPDWLKLLFGLQ